MFLWNNVYFGLFGQRRWKGVWGKRKRISVTYLRNKKFPVNTTPPPQMLVPLCFLVAEWEICSVAF